MCGHICMHNRPEWERQRLGDRRRLRQRRAGRDGGIQRLAEADGHGDIDGGLNLTTKASSLFTFGLKCTGWG
jgi:hypothetical protein